MRKFQLTCSMTAKHIFKQSYAFVRSCTQVPYAWLTAHKEECPGDGAYCRAERGEIASRWRRGRCPKLRIAQKVTPTLPKSLLAAPSRQLFPQPSPLTCFPRLTPPSCICGRRPALAELIHGLALFCVLRSGPLGHLHAFRQISGRAQHRVDRSFGHPLYGRDAVLPARLAVGRGVGGGAVFPDSAAIWL